MTPEILLEISRREAVIEPLLENVDAIYEGTRIPLIGIATIEARRGSIQASIVNTDDWNLRMMRSMPPGEIVSMGSFFRDIAPGYLLGPNAAGSIKPVAGGWLASDVKYVGEGPHRNPPGERFRFNVGKVTIAGPAAERPAAAMRILYAGGEWNATTMFAQKRLVVSGLTDETSRREEETLAATIEGALDDLEQHALWVLLGFISGNRLSSLATEYYEDRGNLIKIEHRRGGPISAGRNEPFHPFYGSLTTAGMTLLGDGILRLMRATHPFPIENVIHQIFEANQGNLDTDAQHLALAIHAAFEAWNRKYGRENWIGDKAWQKMARRIRGSISPESYDVIPEDVRPELKKNIASDMNHSNRTTTGWRQRRMFEALQIEADDTDNKRALALRDELLHNGFFLKRWRELTREEAQQRRDDIERLRRLALLIVFRLTGYEGGFCSPLRLQAEQVTPVPLPPDIAGSAQLANEYATEDKE